MQLDSLFEAMKTLGMPVVIATFLIWHFVRLNKSLTMHNTALVAITTGISKRTARLKRNDLPCGDSCPRGYSIVQSCA